MCCASCGLFIILNAASPHEAYVNELMWRYRPADGLDALLQADIHAAVAGDVDGSVTAHVGALGQQGWLLIPGAPDYSW